MKKIDLVFVAAILATAAALRLSAPWDDVLGSSRVNFLETDAYYHVRLVENQVRNFPHRVTVDPYAAPTGQYVAALAPASNPTPGVSSARSRMRSPMRPPTRRSAWPPSVFPSSSRSAARHGSRPFQSPVSADSARSRASGSPEPAEG